MALPFLAPLAAVTAASAPAAAGALGGAAPLLGAGALGAAASTALPAAGPNAVVPGVGGGFSGMLKDLLPSILKGIASSEQRRQVLDEINSQWRFVHGTVGAPQFLTPQLPIAQQLISGFTR